MPRLRPRSEMSRSTSLIGPLPSRGAYLLSSSSTTKTSGRAVPSDSFSSNMRLRTAPTTKRLARSWRAWMSTTLSCLLFQSRTWSARLPDVLAPDEVSDVLRGRVKAPLESRDGPGRRRPRPPLGEALVAVRVVGERLHQRRRRSRSARPRSRSRRPSRSPFAAAAAASFASIRSTTKLSWLAVSSASAKRKRRRRSCTTSRIVQKKATTPSPRLPVAGRRSADPLRTGARNCALPKGWSGSPSFA